MGSIFHTLLLFTLMAAAGLGQYQDSYGGLHYTAGSAPNEQTGMHVVANSGSAARQGQILYNHDSTRMQTIETHDGFGGWRTATAPVRSGSMAYVSPKGALVKRDYYTDENGFHVYSTINQGTHENARLSMIDGGSGRTLDIMMPPVFAQTYAASLSHLQDLFNNKHMTRKSIVDFEPENQIPSYNPTSTLINYGPSQSQDHGVESHSNDQPKPWAYSAITEESAGLNKRDEGPERTIDARMPPFIAQTHAASLSHLHDLLNNMQMSRKSAVNIDAESQIPSYNPTSDQYVNQLRIIPVSGS